MKIILIIKLITLTILLNSCNGIPGTASHESLIDTNERFIREQHQMKNYRTERWARYDYDANNYIYIYIPKEASYLEDERCVYGMLVDKNDAKTIAYDWKILSGREYCTIEMTLF